MKDLAGKVAVVTGGGSGIGRSMVLAFAEAGMDVAIADVDAAAGDAVAEEAIGLGARAIATRVDVVEAAQLEQLAERVYAELGAAHLLCNNAGVVTFGNMAELSAADWRWVLSVNLDGVINGLQAFLPRMKNQPGEKHIVNTASSAGIAPYDGIGPYVASKYAVVGISETLRVEGAELGIGCSVLCPGNVNTKIVSSARNRHTALGGPDEREYPDVQKQISAGMDPERVGRIVRQAVLDDDPYIFTHPEIRVMAEKRFAAMMRCFDKAEEREREQTK